MYTFSKHRVFRRFRPKYLDLSKKSAAFTTGWRSKSSAGLFFFLPSAKTAQSKKYICLRFFLRQLRPACGHKKRAQPHFLRHTLFFLFNFLLFSLYRPEENSPASKGGSFFTPAAAFAAASGKGLPSFRGFLPWLQSFCSTGVILHFLFFLLTVLQLDTLY